MTMNAKIHTSREVRRQPFATRATEVETPVAKPTDPRDWSIDAEEVAATMHLLVRADVLTTPAQIAEYMSTPWSWTRERAIARKLESVMAENGVTAADGWKMTLRELCERGVKR
jgi:uncharacterized membrane protein